MEAEKSQNLCLVCGFEMDDPPRDYNICPSCGTEYGVNDANASYEQLRAGWLKTGPAWWSKTDPQPENWSPSRQLANLGTVIPSASVLSTGTAVSVVFSAVHPILASGSNFSVQPSEDLFNWAQVWQRRPSEDTQPALV
jgi:hypothetical protein